MGCTDSRSVNADEYVTSIATNNEFAPRGESKIYIHPEA